MHHKSLKAFAMEPNFQEFCLSPNFLIERKSTATVIVYANGCNNTCWLLIQMTQVTNSSYKLMVNY